MSYLSKAPKILSTTYLDNVQSFYHFTENHVLAIQPVGLHSRDEELTSIRVWSRYKTKLGMLNKVGTFKLKFFSISPFAIDK
jgi:hypothetical protein